MGLDQDANVIDDKRVAVTEENTADNVGTYNLIKLTSSCGCKKVVTDILAKTDFNG